MQVQAGQSVDGFVSDVFGWRDAACAPRSAALVRNDRVDPTGKRGGYMRRYTYQVDGATRTCDGALDEHPGFGHVVTHHDDSGTVSYHQVGVYATLLAGRHHAIHEYRWSLSMGGRPVDVTVHWMFATGRDHPLYAITYDCSRTAPNALSADTRSPYGDLLFDGNANAEIAGVEWGDRYRFTSLHSPVTLGSGWDYTQPNTVPYVRMWTTAPDAEMGSVQTQTFAQHPAGGYWLYPSWGTRDADGPMPTNWNWTYQLNQYELPWTTRSHRLAWGSNFGAVGQERYNAYGEETPTLDGYPYQSYSVFVVLGRHSTSPVRRQVAQVEAVQRTTLSATVGTVLGSGPGGVGRTDTVPYVPEGYNPVYGTWEVRAQGDRAALTLDVEGAALEQPVLVVHGYAAATPPETVSLDGTALRADVDFYVTLDDARDMLWLTLARSLQGRHALTLE